MTEIGGCVFLLNFISYGLIYDLATIHDNLSKKIFFWMNCNFILSHLGASFVFALDSVNGYIIFDSVNEYIIFFLIVCVEIIWSSKEYRVLRVLKWLNIFGALYIIRTLKKLSYSVPEIRMEMDKLIFIRTIIVLYRVIILTRTKKNTRPTRTRQYIFPSLNEETKDNICVSTTVEDIKKDYLSLYENRIENKMCPISMDHFAYVEDIIYTNTGQFFSKEALCTWIESPLFKNKCPLTNKSLKISSTYVQESSCVQNATYTNIEWVLGCNAILFYIYSLQFTQLDSHFSNIFESIKS